jgi:hypothetical protein
MIGTLQALGLGGMYQRPKMGVYVDNNSRQWQTNEVEMEEELERDAEGNVIPLLREDGSEVRDPVTGLAKYQPRIDMRTGKPALRPVMTWAHRDPDANTLKWLASHQYSDEFGDAAVEHNVNLRAVTNDATVQTIAARVEAYERKRALPAPEVVDAEVVEQEGDAELPSTPTEGAENT